MNKKFLMGILFSVLSISINAHANQKTETDETISSVQSNVNTEKKLHIDKKEENSSSSKKEERKSSWTSEPTNIEYSELTKLIKNGDVSAIYFSENPMAFNSIRVEFKDGTKGSSSIVSRQNFETLLEQNHVKVDVIKDFGELEKDQAKNAETTSDKIKFYFNYWSGIIFSFIWGFLSNLFSFLIIFFIAIFLVMKYLSGGISSSKNYEKVEAKDIDVSFDDVAGNESAKEDIMETIDFFKNKEKYDEFNASMPTGILLVGPPGNGKTMFAKAIAKECNATFFNAPAASFDHVYAGLGAGRVRQLFKEARKCGKAIIFIDEIDAMTKKRGGMNDYHVQTLNQLLESMDGLTSKGKNIQILVVAATNREDVMDEAILRPGRFDRKVLISKPTKNSRLKIFEKYLEKASSKIKIADNLDYNSIARLTNGFSGADIRNLVNETLLMMIRQNSKELNQEILVKARNKVMLGNPRFDLDVVEKEREITAYHETGHAVISKLVSNGSRTIEGITIIPHEKALGVTFQTEERDTILKSKEELLNDLKVLVGGRAAEQVFLKNITTGASNDLNRAFNIAMQIVSYYGMSEHLPMINIGEYANSMSDQNKAILEKEASTIINQCYIETQKLLTEHSNIVEDVVKVLLDKENIDGQEFENIFNKHFINNDEQSKELV